MDPFRGERIAKLAQHPAWPDLITEVAQQESDYWDTVARKLKTGVAVAQLEIEVKRAYYRGMRAVVGFPEKGQKAIEKHIEKGEN